MKSSKIKFSLLWLAVFVTASFGADLRVGTLNTYLFFNPAIQHTGQVADKEAMTPDQYQAKVSNLASLCHGLDVVGLQETGGRREIEDLAHVTNMQFGFAKGGDTYTGEEVGVLYRLPGWQVTVNGRVGVLDRLISKHILLTAEKDGHRVLFLVVHLIRPIGKQEQKHLAQIEAISRWAEEAANSGSIVVVLGDTNNTTKAPIFGGKEANQLNGYAATHQDGRPFDRLSVHGNASWSDVDVAVPPYGRKPNKANLRVWTDHWRLSATLNLR